MPNSLVIDLIKRVAKLEGKMTVVLILVVAGTGAAFSTLFAVLSK